MRRYTWLSTSIPCKLFPSPWSLMRRPPNDTYAALKHRKNCIIIVQTIMLDTLKKRNLWWVMFMYVQICVLNIRTKHGWFFLWHPIQSKYDHFLAYNFVCFPKRDTCWATLLGVLQLLLHGFLLLVIIHKFVP